MRWVWRYNKSDEGKISLVWFFISLKSLFANNKLYLSVLKNKVSFFYASYVKLQFLLSEKVKFNKNKIASEEKD